MKKKDIKILKNRINNYEIPPIYKLPDWVDLKLLNWHGLSQHPNAINLLEKNQHLIEWQDFALNPNFATMKVEEQYKNKIFHNRMLSMNANAINFLRNNLQYVDLHYITSNYHPDVADLFKILLKDIEFNQKYYNNFMFWFNLSYNPMGIEVLSENIDKIDWQRLSCNWEGIDLLEQHIDKINWTKLCKNRNPKAIKLIENNLAKVDWSALSSNKNAVKILEQNKDEIDWRELSRNENAIELIEQNLDKIDRHILSSNKNAIKILEKHPDIINWCVLSENINAMPILKNNIDEINWSNFMCQTNDEAIEIMEKNLHKIDWKYLSINPKAINILKQNLEKINWFFLSYNLSLFIYDYLSLKQHMQNTIFEELMQNRFHPKNMDKWYYWGMEEENLF